MSVVWGKYVGELCGRMLCVSKCGIKYGRSDCVGTVCVEGIMSRNTIPIRTHSDKSHHNHVLP